MSTGLHQRRQASAADLSSEIQPVEEPGSYTANGTQRPAAAPIQHKSRLKARPCAPAAAAALLGALSILAAVWYLPVLLGRSPGPVAQDGLLLTPEQLSKYDGRSTRRVYLAVMGQVFDVTAGRRHYGPEGGYAFFAGRDASRSYVTGKFSQDAHDDVADFSPEQMRELARWREFYGKHKEYKPVGRVIGRFYDAAGRPSPLLERAEQLAAQHAAAQAQRSSGGQPGQPGAAGSDGAGGFPCNVKWSKAEGGSVWCPDGAFPRRVLQPDWQGQMQERCACLETKEPSGGARLYDGCSADSARCATSPPGQGQ